jgi:kynureninase
MSVDKGTAETSPHYNQLGNDQPILKMLREFTPDEFKGFLKGNSIKYRARAGLKEGQSVEKDTAKAEQYEKWLAEYTAFRLIYIGDQVYVSPWKDVEFIPF